tara:strand:+ start:206 stop:682 length:477 start_codon:yes stop_codon:yes gene_type:complete
MNQSIDKALRKLELSKKVLDEAELILAELMQGDAVPSVQEPEPASEPIEQRIENAGMESTDITPPRTDLVCPCPMKSKVYDNRPNKASGQYKPNAPDFTCANNNDCPNMVQGDTRMLRKSWWLNSKDLPQEYIATTVPQNDEADRVVIDKPEDSASPF